MQTGFLAGKIRHAAVIKLLLSLALLLLGAFSLYFICDGGLLALDGFTATRKISSLKEFEGIGSKLFAPDMVSVTLTASVNDLVDPDIQESNNGVRNADYLAIHLDGKYILCKLSAKDFDTLATQDEYSFTGALTTLGDKETSLVIDSMKEQGIDEQKARALLSVYSVDTTESAAVDRAVLLAVTLLLLGFGLFFTIILVAVAMNPRRYSQIRKMPVDNRDEVFEAIERQLAEDAGENAHELIGKRSTAHLLKDWIVVVRPLHVNFVPASELLWAYKLKQSKRLYGVIPMGSFFFLRLRTERRTFQFQGLETSVDSLLGAIAEKYPWAVLGFSDKLASAWKADVGQFKAYAEAKKQGVASANSDAQPNSAASAEQDDIFDSNRT